MRFNRFNQTNICIFSLPLQIYDMNIFSLPLQIYDMNSYYCIFLMLRTSLRMAKRDQNM